MDTKVDFISMEKVAIAKKNISTFKGNEHPHLCECFLKQNGQKRFRAPSAKHFDKQTFYNQIDALI